MSKNSEEMKKEQAHLQECQNVIRQNIARYEKEYQARHAQSQRLQRAMKSGDVELYNQLMTAVSLEEQAQSGLKKNTAALRKPYFGRIDYTEISTEKEEQVYIGKNGIFRDKTDVLIADWRAPISSVYYENELGKGSYRLPDETDMPVNLHEKRTYDIDDGQLLGYYDSDVAANDELLVKYLSQNKNVVLGEIIATIQKEQNAIIRETPFANLIVQGVAGSGKTTVAMHRISYLLYNYSQRFESNEYCIIGSSDLLLNYITSGLPELDVPNIKHMRMDQLFVRLCEKEWIKKYTAAEDDGTGKYRCSLDFIRELEYFLMKLRMDIIPPTPLNAQGLGTIISDTSIQTLLKENPHFSIDRLLSILEDRMKVRIQFLMSGWDREHIQEKQKEFRGHYRAKKPKASAASLYLAFLSRWLDEKFGSDAGQKTDAAENGDNTDRKVLSQHIARCAAGQFDLYDIVALALIHYRVHQSKPNEEFGLLFLDEAQDFGLSVYYVLKKLLPDTYFTIMGDVSQNINYDTGINDWFELNKLFLTGEKDKFFLLQKSYRNTIEISEYAGKILEKASAGQYKIKPVIRHGLPVVEETFWSDVEMAERVIELVREFAEKKYTATAVICKDDKDASRTYRLLKEMLPDENILYLQDKGADFQSGIMILPVRMAKGLEFDTVILWNPDMKNGLKQPAAAKLLYVAATRALHELYVFQS